MESPQNTNFEDSKNLRELLSPLLKNWKIVIAVTILTMVSAYLAIKFFVEPKYEATSQLTILETSPSISLETSIQAIPRSPESQHVLEIAISDEVLLNVYQILEEGRTVGEDINFESFRKKVKATQLSSSLVSLTVTDSNPNTASEIVNTWAEQVARRVNNLFGISQTKLEIIENQTKEAFQNWHTSQKALEAYLSGSRINAMEAQAAEAGRTLGIYLDKTTRNTLIVQDAQTLETRLGGFNSTDLLSPGDALSLVSLQQRVVDPTNIGNMIQYTLPESNIFGQGYTLGQAQTSLDELVNSLEAQNQSLEEMIIDQESQLMRLVTELETEQFARERLLRDRNLARDAYNVLAVEVQENRIAIIQGNDLVKVSSRAIAPGDPSISVLTITMLAGAVGLMLVVSAVYFLEWWREPENC